GPSKNQTHKIKRRNKVSREQKLHVINKQKQKNKKHTLVVTKNLKRMNSKCKMIRANKI
ncbi:hypothetical protein C1646_732236, partial [Rhizophagus diaphanus]